LSEVEYQKKVRDPENGPLSITYVSNLPTIGDFVTLGYDTFTFKATLP
jgi:hypothetical protein